MEGEPRLSSESGKIKCAIIGQWGQKSSFCPKLLVDKCSIFVLDDTQKLLGAFLHKANKSE